MIGSYHLGEAVHRLLLPCPAPTWHANLHTIIHINIATYETIMTRHANLHTIIHINIATYETIMTRHANLHTIIHINIATYETIMKHRKWKPSVGLLWVIGDCRSLSVKYLLFGLFLFVMNSIFIKGKSVIKWYSILMFLYNGSLTPSAIDGLPL